MTKLQRLKIADRIAAELELTKNYHPLVVIPALYRAKGLLDAWGIMEGYPVTVQIAEKWMKPSNPTRKSAAVGVTLGRGKMNAKDLVKFERPLSKKIWLNQIDEGK